MYSNADSNPIYILNDNTYPQLDNSSMIYLPYDGSVYTNGNAYAIRLLWVHQQNQHLDVPI